jgi:hypothetical protein
MTAEKKQTVLNFDMPELASVVLQVCKPCLNGAEGECHSPGCAFWCCPAPTAEQAERICLAAESVALIDEVRVRRLSRTSAEDMTADDVEFLIAAVREYDAILCQFGDGVA